jgi:4-hydroxybenzoate polyprenyltransferase
VNTSKKFNCRLLANIGNTLTIVGCTILLFGFIGLIPLEIFAVGLSSGIRIVGMFAIMGCLMSAIGYGLMDYFDY